MRQFATRLVAVATAMLLPAMAHAGTTPAAYGFAANDVEFLNLMGNVEAPDGFGQVFDGVPLDPRVANQSHLHAGPVPPVRAH